MASSKKQEKKSGGFLRELFGWMVYICVIIFLTWAIITFVGQRTRVSGESMMTTLNDGDNLIVEKISYRFHDPERFDIIVLPFKYEKNTYYIKRIIGLPGETVQIIEGCVYINGEKLTSDVYGAETMEYSGIFADPIELGEDQYFVLGDNRNHSSDSRDPSVGILMREDLIGKAWIRIYPFDQFGVIKHE